MTSDTTIIDISRCADDRAETEVVASEGVVAIQRSCKSQRQQAEMMGAALAAFSA